MEIRSAGGNLPTSPVPQQSQPQDKLARTISMLPEQTATSPASQMQGTRAAGGAQPSRNEVEESVATLNQFIKSLNNPMLFSIDDDTGKTVVKIVDSTTQEVIKQIPSEEILSIAKALDKLKGLFIEQKA